MKRLIFLILIGCCGIIGSNAQTMAFVSATAANDDGDGLSWETAKKTIPAALNLVGNNGVVCVKAGNYSLSAQLNIPAGVMIKGGYTLLSSGTDTTHWELPGLNSRWENSSICTISCTTVHVVFIIIRTCCKNTCVVILTIAQTCK